MNLVSEPNAKVRVVDLKKKYSDTSVLNGITLNAYKGQVLTLIGSSGSGKSTLLRCINLLETPTSGSIYLDQEVLEFQNQKGMFAGQAIKSQQIDQWRRRAGMVFQNFNLWAHMTVLENVIEAPMQVLKLSKSQAIAQAEVLLQKVGLIEKKNTYPAYLSGGQQQRVAIARALAMNPEVLLLDEPTSALDPEMVGDVLQVIKALAEEGRTMILVTHEMQFAKQVSSQVAYLHQGLVEECGPPEQVFNAPISARCRQFVHQS